MGELIEERAIAPDVTAVGLCQLCVGYPAGSFPRPCEVQSVCRQRSSKLQGDDAMSNPKGTAFLVNFLKAVSLCRGPICNCLPVKVSEPQEGCDLAFS